MYKRRKIKKLGRTKTHRKSLINNQLKTLFEFGYVRTTTPKAKVLRTNAESLISKSSDTLSFNRTILDILGKKDLVKKFTEYSKGEKKGVKIIKLGFRPGDMSEMSRVELIGFKKAKRSESKKEGKKEEITKEVVNKKKEKRNIIEEITKRAPKVAVKKVDSIPKKERAKSRSGL